MIAGNYIRPPVIAGIVQYTHDSRIIIVASENKYFN